MKISNSKKALAKAIHDNGGWRDGAKWSVQQKTYGRIVFTKNDEKPTFDDGWDGNGSFFGDFITGKALPNWHQTILSKMEYYHLYPLAVDVENESCEPVTRTMQTPTIKPTIDQLVANYRNRLDYASRKRQEADDAKAAADAALSDLKRHGAEVGLEIGIAKINPREHISGCDDLRAGDTISW